VRTPAEDLVLRFLTLRMQENSRAVPRIRRDDLLPDGHTETITDAEWATAVERLLDSGQILVYKINDLPGSLPLISYSARGYTTQEHLLGLLKQARGYQAEEILDYLEFQGVPVPQPKIRAAVTAAQKKRIDAAVRKLNEIRAEVAGRNPDNRVTWYLDGTQNFCLMVEPDGQMEMRQSDIAHSVTLRASGGGDW
jgi:hypothetical protein